MAIAKTLKKYLETQHVDYDLVPHSHAETAEEAAHAAQVPTHQVAKAVVLEDRKGYVLGVVPADNRVNLRWVANELDREFELATERELVSLFEDCDAGAVPAIGDAYGLDVIWDDQLKNARDIYIEAGDHETLIHLNGTAFEKLMANKPHNIISAHDGWDRPIFE